MADHHTKADAGGGDETLASGVRTADTGMRADGENAHSLDAAKWGTPVAPKVSEARK
jgi:hypothetical protein